MSRCIVITGANSGIGFHMARALLEHHDRVAVLDLEGDNLAPLGATHGNRLKFVRCDVGDDARVREAIQSIVTAWGRVDVLINNACVCQFGPFERRSAEQRRREFEVNYFGYVNTIAAVLPHMKERGNGWIYNVGSGIGITGFPGISTYASAKGAIEALTRSLALELQDSGISVSLMHPPLTRTPSATPLGVPLQAMADASVVGRRLAKQVGSRRPVITPDFATAVSLILFRLLPGSVGRLLSRLTASARASAQKPS